MPRSDLQPIKLMIADYSPDMPSLDNPGSGNIENCIPLTPQSYGPFSQLLNFGDAISGQCLGAIAAEDNTGNTYVFAGDATDLFSYSASATPTNVSQSAAVYTLAQGERWRFTQFGQRIVASDYDDALQSYILGSSTKFTDLANGNITSLVLVGGSGYTNGTYALSVTGAGSGSGFAGTVTAAGGGLASFAITNMGKNYPQTATIGIPAGAGAGTGGSITPVIQTIAPKARFMAVIDDFLVLGNTVDNTNGSQTQRVWWSALNDPTNFPTPGSATAVAFQSSFNDLFGDGGEIMGIVGNLGNADGAVFEERAVFRVLYQGGTQTFAFIQAEGAQGCLASDSIVHLGGYAYYWGQNGICKFDGSVSTPIGTNRVDRTIYGMVDFGNIHRVEGRVDPTTKMIYWAFPSLANTNGNPDTILAYNWVLDKFSIITGVTLETLLFSLSFGTTLANMPGGALSNINIPLASRQWTGGALIFGGFDTSHRLSYFNGPALQAVIDTTEMQPFPGQLTFVQNTRPIVDGGIDNPLATPSVPTVQLSTRDRLMDTPVAGAAASLNYFGTCPLTANGRYIKAETVIPGGSNWQHFQGIELEARPNGVQ